MGMPEKRAYWDRTVPCVSRPVADSSGKIHNIDHGHNWDGRACLDCGLAIKIKLSGERRWRGAASAPRKVFLKDQKCAYCERAFSFTVKRTVDHIVPLSRGGERNSLDNLCLACEKCNSEKGNKLLDEWTERWYLQSGG